MSGSPGFGLLKLLLIFGPIGLDNLYFSGKLSQSPLTSGLNLANITVAAQ
tara:strand:- start:8 stop:157 length:150 start_codon:yes stop_codon:yes gene_type:complete